MLKYNLMILKSVQKGTVKNSPRLTTKSVSGRFFLQRRRKYGIIEIEKCKEKQHMMIEGRNKQIKMEFVVIETI